MKKKSIGLAVGILAVVLLSVVGTVPATADVTTVDVAMDTYIDNWGPDWAAGGPGGNQNWIVAGSWETGRYRAGVVKFNLPTLPLGKIYSAAQLGFHISSAPSADASFQVRSMSNSWDETTATANIIWAADNFSSVLDTQIIGPAQVGSRVEWNVLSAVQSAGSGGTVSFIVDQVSGPAGLFQGPTKEGDPSLTNTPKLLVTISDGLIADTYIDNWNPDWAAGGPGGNQNWIAAGSWETGRHRAGVVKFNMPALPLGKIYKEAKLSFHISGAPSSNASFQVKSMDNCWDETTATYSSIMALGGFSSVLDTQTIGPAQAGSRVEWNVLSAAQSAGSNGTVSFIVDQASGPEVIFTSPTKEGDPSLANTPKLLVTISDMLSADTYIDNWNPDWAAGGPGGNQSWIVAGSWETGRHRAGVVKFKLPVLTGSETVSAAQLSFHISSAPSADASFQVRSMNNGWDETTATYNSIMALGGFSSALDTQTIGPAQAGSRVEWNVLSAVQSAGSNGTVSFIVDQASGPEVIFTSPTKEGDPSLTNTPKLLLTIKDQLSTDPAVDAYYYPDGYVEWDVPARGSAKRIMPFVPSPVQTNPEPTPTPAETSRGYITFSPAGRDGILSEYRPSASEITNSTSIFACPREYEFATFAIRPLKNLGMVTFTCSDFIGPGGAIIPASNADTYIMKPSAEQIGLDGNQVHWASKWLSAGNTAQATTKNNVQVYVDMHVPASQTPGVYTGTVAIQPGGITASSFNISLEVLDLNLARSTPWGFFDYDWTNVTGRASEILWKLNEMRRNGLTQCVISPIAYGNSPAVYAEGTVDCSIYDQCVDLYKQAGFEDPPVIAMEGLMYTIFSARGVLGQYPFDAYANPTFLASSVDADTRAFAKQVITNVYNHPFTAKPGMDTYIDNWNPDWAAGGPGGNQSWIVAGSWETGRHRAGVVKFKLPVLTGSETVSAAQLSFHISSAPSADASFQVRSMNNGWDETTATYNSIMALGGFSSALDTQTIGPAQAGSRVEWNVLSAVQSAGSSGTVSFIVDHASGPEVIFQSPTKEGDPSLTNTPKLLVTISGQSSPYWYFADEPVAGLNSMEKAKFMYGLAREITTEMKTAGTVYVPNDWTSLLNNSLDLNIANYAHLCANATDNTSWLNLAQGQNADLQGIGWIPPLDKYWEARQLAFIAEKGELSGMMHWTQGFYDDITSWIPYRFLPQTWKGAPWFMKDPSSGITTWRSLPWLGIREGIDDSRYVCSVSLAADTADARGYPAAAEIARSELQAVLDEVHWVYDSRDQSTWTLTIADSERRRLADAAIACWQAIGGP